MKGAITVVLLLLTGFVATAACGGPDKPPLQPDGPDMTLPDGGGPTPSAVPAK